MNELTNAQFINLLRQRNIDICVQDGRLKITAPVGAVDATLRGELTRRKAELLTTLPTIASAPTRNPLKPASRPERIPQTDAQQGLWLVDHFNPGNAAYNIPAAGIVEGFVELSAMQTAVDRIIARHETLRTSFYEEDGELFQNIAPEIQSRVGFTDLSTLGEEERNRSLDRLLREEAQKPFDLGHAPLVRFHLFRLSEQQHVFFFNIHHIIADRRSLEILREELTALYLAAARNETVHLPELPIQYADYAIWATQPLTRSRLDRQIDYWKTKLAELPTYLDLPGSRPYPEERAPWGAAVPVEVNATLRDALIKIGQQEGATLFMTLLAAFAVLLYRTTGSEDFCIGSPSTLRKHVETEPLIGLFVNMLVLRCELNGLASFREVLRRVRTTALEAYDNSDVPFQQLVRCLRPDPRSMRSPFFQVTFGFDSNVGKDASQSHLIEATPGTARFDLTLQLADCADGIRGSMEYCTDLFDKASMTNLSRQFVMLLSEISANPDSSVSNLRISETAVIDDPSLAPRQDRFWKGAVQRFTARFSPRPQGNAATSGK